MKGTTRQNSTESTLTPKQVEVVGALAGGASVTEAAKRAGIDRSTIYLWMRNSGDFKGALILARRERADTMRARLRELADEAVMTVR